MITTIKFRIPSAASSNALLEAAVASPLVVDVVTNRPVRAGSAVTTRVSLGLRQALFATLEFQPGPTGQPRLVAIEGNLPALLHGHEDRMIGSQADLELALTRFRELVTAFVDFNEAHLIFPGLQPGNTTHIVSLGLAIQVEDKLRSIFAAASTSKVRGSREVPLFKAGMVSTLPGPDVTWTVSELAVGKGDGEIVPHGHTCTRLEASVSDMELIAGGIGLRNRSAHLIATLPFSSLFQVYRYAAKRTLTGSLAAPVGASSRAISKNIAFILGRDYDPVIFHLALRMIQAESTELKVDGIAQKVFNRVNSNGTGVLTMLLRDGLPSHLMRNIKRAQVEADHEAAMLELGLASLPAPDISGAFSGIMTLNVGDPTEHRFDHRVPA